MSIISRLLGKPDVGMIPYSKGSPEELAARWVQWGASTNINCNPIADLTGEFAEKEQPDDVWFLAGCFGGVLNRKCTIPGNTKIFMPIFNMWFTDHYDPPDLDKAYGFLNIDGQEIEIDRIFTKKPFIVRGVRGNPVTGSIFEYSMRVDGLWKLIDPLQVGKHQIFIRGSDGYDFFLEVNYEITVVA